MELLTVEGNLKQIAKLLTKADILDEFVIEDEAVELPKEVSLEVENFGFVRFPPLDDEQLTSFIEFCSTHGVKNEFKAMSPSQEFFLHLSLPQSYALSPAQVKIADPQWDEKLSQLLKRIAQQAGVKDEIEVNR